MINELLRYFWLPIIFELCWILLTPLTFIVIFAILYVPILADKKFNDKSQKRKNEFSFGAGVSAKLKFLDFPFLVGLITSILIISEEKSLIILGIFLLAFSYFALLNSVNTQFFSNPIYLNVIRLTAIQTYLIKHRTIIPKEELYQYFNRGFSFIILHFIVALLIFSYLCGLSYYGVAKWIGDPIISSFGDTSPKIILNSLYTGIAQIFQFTSTQYESYALYKIIKIIHVFFALYFLSFVLNLIMQSFQQYYAYFRKYLTKLKTLSRPIAINVFFVLPQGLKVKVEKRKLNTSDK